MIATVNELLKMVGNVLADDHWVRKTTKRGEYYKYDRNLGDST